MSSSSKDTARDVTHSTFTLVRDFDASPDRVFHAWADKALRDQWFGGEGHTMDFRVGGQEIAEGGPEGGPFMRFTTTYHEIIADQRLAYTSTMTADDSLTTVSLTTVEFEPSDGGTHLVLTEHGAYLDGHELPEWRETGTGEQLDALKALVATL